MKSKKLDRGTILVFDAGDEVVSTLTKFAKEHRISAAHFTAIGAFSDAGIVIFRLAEKGLPEEPGGRASRSCFAHRRHRAR